MKDLSQGEVAGTKRSRSSYRRWSEEQKRAIVAETSEAGMSVSLVARRHNVNANQLFQWRSRFKKKEGALALAGFVPVRVEQAAVPQTECPMVIELKCGTVVKVDRHVDGNALRLVLSALRSQP